MDEFHLGNTEKEELKVILEELLFFCRQYNLPMFASVATDNTEEKTEYENVIYTAKAHGIKLQNDQINQYMLIGNGFHAVPPRDVYEAEVMQGFLPGKGE